MRIRTVDGKEVKLKDGKLIDHQGRNLGADVSMVTEDGDMITMETLVTLGDETMVIVNKLSKNGNDNEESNNNIILEGMTALAFKESAVSVESGRFKILIETKDGFDEFVLTDETHIIRSLENEVSYITGKGVINIDGKPYEVERLGCFRV